MDERNNSGFLNSYFPASIRLPFPAPFHATLELDANRMAMKENSDLNERVLHDLGMFYAETLARLVKSKQESTAFDLSHQRSGSRN